jgi:hypothetical protein
MRYEFFQSQVCHLKLAHHRSLHATNPAMNPANAANHAIPRLKFRGGCGGLTAVCGRQQLAPGSYL